MQTEKSLIRHRILRCLIWVSTVYLRPTEWTYMGKYGKKTVAVQIWKIEMRISKWYLDIQNCTFTREGHLESS